MAAKLPVSLISAPKRLMDLPFGSESLISVGSVAVDSDLSVYLWSRAELELVVTERDQVLVRRDDQGLYHLDLRGTKRKFEPIDLGIWHTASTPLLIAVESITGFNVEGEELYASYPAQDTL